MGLWSKLQFFDKNGKNLNFKYDQTNDKWTGDIYMSEVSINLFETAQLFIVQEFVNASTNTFEFGYPHTTAESIPNTDQSGPWAVYGTDESVFSNGTGYYYPLYTNEQDAIDANDGPPMGGLPNGLAHVHRFTQYPGIDFYMPNSAMNHGASTNGGFSVYGGEGWNVDWKDTDPTQIFLFSFDKTFQSGTQSALLREPDGPPLEEHDEIFYKLDYDANQVQLTNDFLETSIITSAALEINVAFSSSTGNTYRRTLVITDTVTNTVLAEITFYGESVEEDERLKVITQNLGYNIIDTDSTIFRNTDINEILPNFEEINRKRREIIMEGHNIYPFIGSYKGLVNALKYFGYDNMSIREYWKNIDKASPKYGKYIQTTPVVLDMKTSDFNDQSITLPNKKFRKTSLFSLVYKLNDIKPGEFTDEDLPITEETSEFTTEEVIIKLFGLKRKLEKDFLPLNARIKDIIGEADFFGLNEVTNSIRRNLTNSITAGVNVDFKITPDGCGNIKDLRDLLKLAPPCTKVDNAIIGQTFICPIPGYPGQNLVLGPYDTGEEIEATLFGPDLNSVLGEPVDGNDFTISDIADFYLAYFSRYAPNINTLDHIPGRSSNRLPDKPDIEIGYPVVLTNDSFNSLTYDDINSTYNELGSGVIYRFEFIPENVSVNDVFIITDPITGTDVRYTAVLGDNSSDVVDGLFDAVQVEIDARNRPWFLYEISKETNDNGIALVISGSDSNRLVPSVILDSSLNSATLTKNQLPGNLLYTWDNILRGNFIEMEWTVFKDADADSGSFFYTIRGSIDELDSIPVILPGLGKYNVELKLFDLYNNISSTIKSDFICVEPLEVEFSGWYQARQLEYKWQDSKYTWGDYGAFWDLPIPPKVLVNDETPALYDSLDSVNAILNTFGINATPSFQMMNFQSNGKVSFAGPYYWDNMDTGSWNDTYHLWWDMTRVTGDTPAYFEFDQVEPGSFLQIIDVNNEVGTHFFPTSTSTLLEAKRQLNESTDPIISKYIYNAVLKSTATGDSVVYIQATARYAGKYGDFTSIDMIDQNGNRICRESTSADIVATGCESIIFDSGQSRTNNPTYNTVKFLNDGKVLPRYTWAMFVYDKCKIAGKKNPKWRIKETTGKTGIDIYFESKHLTYMFKEKGKYEISLELEDSNGNKYSTTRNMVVIK